VYGKLVMGINLDQRLCLADGTYLLRFDSVAESDDWLGGMYYYAEGVGIEEYTISVGGVEMKVAQSLNLQVKDGQVIVTVNSDDGESESASNTTSGVNIGLIVGVLFACVLFVGLVVLIYVLFFRQRRDATAGKFIETLSVDIDLASMHDVADDSDKNSTRNPVSSADNF